MVIPLNPSPNTLANTLTVVSNIQRVDPDSVGSSGNPASYEQRADSGEKRFASGQTVEVKVVSSEGGGRYTLEAEGMRMQIESRSPLGIGQRLQVQVFQGEKGLLLAVQSADASQLLTRTLATGGSSQALAALFGAGLGKLLMHEGGTLPANTANPAALSAAPVQAARRGGGAEAAVQTAAKTGNPPDNAMPPQPSPQRVPQSAAEKMVGLQHKFIAKTDVPPPSSLSITTPAPRQTAQIIEGFSSRLGQVITPLLASGRNEEALQQFTAALRGIAPFFSAAGGAGNAAIQNASPSQQLLYYALTARTPAENAAGSGNMAGRVGQAAQGRKPAQTGVQSVPEKAAAISAKSTTAITAANGRSIEQITARLFQQLSAQAVQASQSSQTQQTTQTGEGVNRQLQGGGQYVSGGQMQQTAQAVHSPLTGTLPHNLQAAQFGQAPQASQAAQLIQSFAELFTAISPLLKFTETPPSSLLSAAHALQRLQAGQGESIAQMMPLQDMQTVPSQPSSQFARFFFQQMQAAGIVSYPQTNRAETVEAANMQAALSPVFAPTAEEGESAGALLRQLIEGLGLDMEKLLLKGDTENAARGLKYQLNKLRHQLALESRAGAESTGGKEAQAMHAEKNIKRLGDVHQSLQSLEFLQVLQANMEKEGALLLPLPLSFLEQGYLLYEDYGGKGEEEGEAENGARRLSLLLKLSSLGNVRVDLLQNSGQIYIRFHTESEEVKTLFKQFDHELPPNLSPLAVQPPSYSTKPAEDPLSSLLRRCSGDSGYKKGYSLFSAQA